MVEGRVKVSIKVILNLVFVDATKTMGQKFVGGECINTISIQQV